MVGAILYIRWKNPTSARQTLVGKTAKINNTASNIVGYRIQQCWNPTTGTFDTLFTKKIHNDIQKNYKALLKHILFIMTEIWFSPFNNV